MTLDKQVLFHSTLHEASLSSPPPETNSHHEQPYKAQVATSTERSRREASTDSEKRNSSSSNSKPFWTLDNTISTTSAFADPLPQATLLVNDLFIAETLHKICPLNFSDTWLASVQAKYWASILSDNSATNGQKGEKSQLLSLVFLFNRGDTSSFSSSSSMLEMSQQSGTVARDRTQYLSNISEIITDIEQFQRHRQQVRGDSSLEDKNADDSHDSAAASGNNADVELLLKDIRSYTLTNTTNSCAATAGGGESGKPAEVIDDKTATSQSLCLANDSSNDHNNNNNTLYQTVEASSAAIGQRAQSNSDRSNDAQLRRRKFVCASSSALLDSILCRLAKLLHGCIESESTRYEFYQIFSDAIHDKKMDFVTDSYQNLNGLVNSLANFDLNSSQIILPGCSPQPTKVHTPISESGNCRTEGTSLSNGKDSFTSTSGTMHFYQSVMDCCDELSTSGGSTSSGYGRSSTTSNSSNGMNTLNNNLSGLVQLDVGLLSPTRQLFREALLSKPVHTPTSNCSTSPGNIGSGTSSALESLSTESTCSNFINSQLSAVAAELCDLDDLPKLISPTESLPHPTYNSSFDLRLPTLSNTSNHHGLLPQPDTSLNFFTDYSQRTNSNNLFDEERSVPTKSNSIDSNDSNNFTISSVTPPSVSSNQCFTISMDNSLDNSLGVKFETRSASMFDKRSTAVEVASACLNDSFISTPSTSNGSAFHHNSLPAASLVDRDLLYRLIISQLLFHGHRTIANQLASAERIKADGSLLSPNNRLHTLVSVAFRNEINQISANPTPEITVFGNLRPTASSAPFQLTDVKEPLNNGLASRTNVDESTGHLPTKNVFERSQSHLGHSVYSTMMFNHSKGGIDRANASEANANFNEVSDVYGNVSSTDLYFSGPSGSRSSGMVVGCNGQPGIMKQLSHPTNSHLDTSPVSVNRSQSNNSLRSGPIDMGTPTGSTPIKSPPLLASTVLDLNTSSGSGAMNFVLNENAMKNLNQLAQINEGACGSNSFTCNGTSSIFGRSASAMASMGPNSSATAANTLDSVMAVHQMVAHGTKSPISLSATPNGSLINGGGSSGPSHTTGNGKNHNVMQIRCKFGSLGPQTNQFSSPHGFCLGSNEEIVIADTNNHRICVYEKNGTFKHSFGNPGKDEGQLWYPRKITMISHANVRDTLQNPLYVICDRGMERSRMQIFTRRGTFMRKIPIRYIDIVAGIAVNAYGQIVTVDSVSPTIFIISETGDLLEWFDCSDHMREPSDIAIFKKDYYICDFKGHCVVVFNERGKCIRKIGIESLTSFPNGIDISANGDILVGDSHGNRFHVAIFNQEGKLLTEYECPYVKVSRCCGLKLTSEGYVVTLAKNNHHVLVLNTLFITNVSPNLL